MKVEIITKNVFEYGYFTVYSCCLVFIK